jgi:hypothetical protein
LDFRRGQPDEIYFFKKHYLDAVSPPWQEKIARIRTQMESILELAIS